MKMMEGRDNLSEDILTLRLFHRRSHLDVVEKVHAGQTVRHHFDIVVDVVLEKVGHFDNVWMAETGFSEIIQNVNLQRYGPELSIACPRVDQNAFLGDVFQYDFVSRRILVSSKLDLAVGSLAHVFEDGKIIDRLPLRWFIGR